MKSDSSDISSFDTSLFLDHSYSAVVQVILKIERWKFDRNG